MKKHIKGRKEKTEQNKLNGEKEAQMKLNMKRNQNGGKILQMAHVTLECKT